MVATRVLHGAGLRHSILSSGRGLVDCFLAWETAMGSIDRFVGRFRDFHVLLSLVDSVGANGCRYHFLGFVGDDLSKGQAQRHCAVQNHVGAGWNRRPRTNVKGPGGSLPCRLKCADGHSIIDCGT